MNSIHKTHLLERIKPRDRRQENESNIIIIVQYYNVGRQLPR
jgi:hypothetical protein